MQVRPIIGFSRTALVLALLTPRLGFCARDEFWPQVEFQTLASPMGHSEIKNAGGTSSFSGMGYQFRLGADLGMIAVLGYYGLSSQENEKQMFGITQSKSDTEMGALIRVDTTKMFGLVLGGGTISSKVKDAGRAAGTKKLEGTRVFLGVNLIPCLNDYVCGVIELSGTAMGQYSKINGQKLQRTAQWTGFDAALGFSLRW